MEVRRQEQEIGRKRSLSFITYNNNPPPLHHPPPRLNHESSSSPKLPPSATIISTLADIPRQETSITLDRHPLHQHLQSLQQHTSADTAVEESILPDQDSPTPVSAAAAACPSSNPKTPPPQLQSQRQDEKVSSAGNTSSANVISYHECLKNHAANMGGHVFDGCGEFMPGGEEGTPDAFCCAACGCHRNFHRKEVDGEVQYTPNCYYARNPSATYISTRRDTIYPTAPLPPLASPPPLLGHSAHHHLHHSQYGQAACPTQVMAFGGSIGAAAESSSEDLNMYQPNSGQQIMGQQYPSSCSASKKRFRTKFTQEQKERMHEFAERLRWRIQKQDDADVQRFCDAVNITRQVFKVWMHNNKQNYMKKKTM